MPHDHAEDYSILNSESLRHARVLTCARAEMIASANLVGFTKISNGETETDLFKIHASECVHFVSHGCQCVRKSSRAHVLVLHANSNIVRQ
jgi:hypothetical protein